ncbi:hypothetical protein D3Z47_06475 [Lachnospiraceae bacterium]|nr:hypothetical protein [Lachnospiraceae bacterium]
MTGKTIVYRGSLKSCNYHCSYCPFSKHRISAAELKKDRAQWFSFIQSFKEHSKSQNIRALLVAPYGEALIHPWYWEGLALVSACQNTDAIGAQTNLSFPLTPSLSQFTNHGGILKKLRLWATFHPQMATAKTFASKCTALTNAGVSLCAGAVGVPDHIGVLQTLREKLPKEIYLWINKMDGLKRPYTKEEQDAFLQIDPYFLRELAPVPADMSECCGRLFVEGDGKLHTCNISPALHTGQKKPVIPSPFPPPQCSRRLCSCYLAYGGRSSFLNQILFGPYPLFRIPRRPKAVFLDIEGTLLHKQGKTTCIPKDILAGITALFLENIPLFFATTLPCQEAKSRCKPIWHMFSGGIFSGGAHLFLKATGKEAFHYLPGSDFKVLLHLEQKHHFRTLSYKNQGKLYKITLYRPSHHPWNTKELQELEKDIPAIRHRGIRYFTEENCLQIVSASADKAQGVRTICNWIGISPKEAAAAGNSEEDAKMLEICGT